MSLLRGLSGVCFLMMGLAASLGAEVDFEAEPIRYTARTASDPVAVLKSKIEKGSVALVQHPRFGYLISLLGALGVSTNSQILVFSKTSLQVSKIQPDHPRAVYFNDTVYVGYIPGSPILELVAIDSNLGTVFYTFESGVPEKNGESASGASSGMRPQIQRDRGDCLVCHANSRTEYVPGLLVRSVYADAGGKPRIGSTTYATDYRSPFAHRWGGWYVTGGVALLPHMGNGLATNRLNSETLFPMSATNGELPALVPRELYPMARSEALSLMLLETQLRIHNLMTRAAFEARAAIFQMKSSDKAVPAELTGRLSESAENLIEGLFYCGEAALPGEIHPPRDLVEAFQKGARKTRDGRSLKDLDLKSRLFRYRLSYLVDTEMFRSLPPPLLEYLRGRFREILRGGDRRGSLGELSDADRTDLVSVLRETHPEML